MKLIDHLNAVELFVLEHEPPDEIRNHLKVLQEHLEAEDATLDRNIELERLHSEKDATRATVTAKVANPKHALLEPNAIKALKHFSNRDCVVTFDEIQGLLGSSKAEVHNECDKLLAGGYIVAASIPMSDPRFEGISPTNNAGFLITAAGNAYLAESP